MRIKISTIFGVVLLLSMVLTACMGQAAAETPATTDEPQATKQAATETNSATPFLPAEQTATSLPSPSPTLRPSSTPIPSTTPAPSLTPLPSPTPIPEEFHIQGIFGFRQTYAISCESRSATDWAVFFGKEAYEADIQFRLPNSDNPDEGFVGNFNDPWGQVPPYSYGVHAAPIANVLNELYNLPARAEKNFTLEAVKQELASGQPVIAWVIGNMVAGFPAEYTDKAGKTTIVAAYEHTVILTGYGLDHIRYINNGRFFEIPTDIFLRSWGTLGNMVVYYED
ncbi:MAG: hypothetical protein CVU39_26015 [Chloroflexi bacterium HGW-Chloroflexi-10]|nr:MAG: hypothetical protein CVU39_26015 [Chloroflexi bacterium HGW-Chloroflexi-10]